MFDGAVFEKPRTEKGRGLAVARQRPRCAECHGPPGPKASQVRNLCIFRARGQRQFRPASAEDGRAATLWTRPHAYPRTRMNWGICHVYQIAHSRRTGLHDMLTCRHVETQDFDTFRVQGGCPRLRTRRRHHGRTSFWARRFTRAGELMRGA